ncbi:C6 finger domain containing protein [Fusarium agapanthi]|uniref:C6 finger domain containing protein n=1 Tax=Fusarium agapanthi TaxID=1803897 RepID=A0A9P5BCC8_9HYPO|nr:C6 finger domain containing protein [Fusarium agapanthi]
MSLTARERRNPPSRRKSCTACTKAKRRCDFALPACLRCSQRQISCQYPTRTIRGQLTPQSESPETEPHSLLSIETSPQVSGSFPISWSIIEDFNTIISRIDASSNGLDTFDIPLEDVALELAQQPLALTGPSTQDFGNVSAHVLNRLQWAVDEIKEAPKKMVLENQTPWCHPLLYKDAMPRSMQGEDQSSTAVCAH